MMWKPGLLALFMMTMVELPNLESPHQSLAPTSTEISLINEVLEKIRINSRRISRETSEVYGEVHLTVLNFP